MGVREVGIEGEPTCQVGIKTPTIKRSVLDTCAGYCSLERRGWWGASDRQTDMAEPSQDLCVIIPALYLPFLPRGQSSNLLPGTYLSEAGVVGPREDVEVGGGGLVCGWVSWGDLTSRKGSVGDCGQQVRAQGRTLLLIKD